MRLKSCPPKTDALTISKRREIPHSADNVRNDNVRFFPQAVKSCPAEVQEFSRRLLTTPLRSIVRSGLSSFRGGPLTACRTAFAGAGFSKPRERVGRGGGGTLATQCAERGIGAFAGRLGRQCSLRRARGFSFLARRRRKVDAGAASLGEANRDGLLCGPSAMNTLVNVLHFLANKFTGLRGGRFAFFFVALGASNGFLFGHKKLL